MLQLGNYILYNGHTVKAKELYPQKLTIESEDKALLNISYDEIRFIELRGEVLLKLMDQDKQICRLSNTIQHTLHKRECYEVTLRGVKFYLNGFLYDDISIWQFLNVITIHYLHQFQNVIAILNPEVCLDL